MAALTDPQRAEVWAEYMREPRAVQGLSALTKVQLRGAINAIDDWLEANAAAFNTAIPQPQRGLLTTKQKAALLRAVISKRFDAG